MKTRPSNKPKKNTIVCYNCKFYQNENSEKYECKFNGPWGSCKEFASKYGKVNSKGGK